jgi:hypothetical protein
MKWLRKIAERVIGGSLLNPASWMGWALVLIGAWGLAAALGWRGDTAVICGTVDPARGSGQWVMMRGMIYALAYFGAVMVSPVLVLASGVYGGMVVVTRRCRNQTQARRHEAHEGHEDFEEKKEAVGGREIGSGKQEGAGL